MGYLDKRHSKLLKPQQHLANIAIQLVSPLLYTVDDCGCGHFITAAYMGSSQNYLNILYLHQVVVSIVDLLTEKSFVT